jgi:hypothetical protein
MVYAGGGYGWHKSYAPDTRPFMKDWLVRLFGHLHYLTSHAPKKVNSRWKQADIRMHNRMKYRKSALHERF